MTNKNVKEKRLVRCHFLLSPNEIDISSFSPTKKIFIQYLLTQCVYYLDNESKTSIINWLRRILSIFKSLQTGQTTVKFFVYLPLMVYDITSR